MTAGLFAISVLIWGTTWLAISFQVGPVPVTVSVFYRFAIAAAVVTLGLAVVGRLKAIRLADQPFVLAQALCLFSMNFVLLYQAAAFIPSGLIAVIFSLSTIYNGFNARLFFGDAITRRTLVAALLGVLGLALIFSHDIAGEMAGGAINWDTLNGVGLAALGTLLFSLGNMASRRNSARGIAPITANMWGMAYGAAVLLAVIVATETPIVAPPNLTYTAALLYLAVVGSVVGFTTYLLLVARLGSSQAAYATVLFPIVALTLSTGVEGYEWHWTALMGVVMALVGNLVMFARPRDLRALGSVGRAVTPWAASR